MNSILANLEAKACDIRKELKARYKLAAIQVAALPTVEQLDIVASRSVEEIIPIFWDSILTKQDQKWLEHGPLSDDIFSELTPPREIKFNNAQESQWQIMSNLSSFHISFIFAMHDPFASGTLENKKQKQEERKLDVLTAYEEACVTLIESRNKNSKEKSGYANFLSFAFPIPSDNLFPKPPKKRTLLRRGRNNLRKPD